MSVASLRTIAEVREYRNRSRTGGIVGLVPTMGALHAGHGSLIDRARSECDQVIVSVFVNGLQFGPNEDFDSYPRDLDADLKFCSARRVDAVFAPSSEEMYPEEPHTFVEVGPEGQGLCGDSRPGHFRGVATVVLKLFNIVAPDRAYFGEKDFQQLAVVSRMIRDFNIEVEIVGVPTVREPDGLAISSRNANLGPEERRAASVLYRALRVARQRIADGDTDPAVAKQAATMVLELEPTVRVDYLEVVDPDGMTPVERIAAPVRTFGAIWIGDTRLMDNVLCTIRKKPRRRKKS